jgi:hypothetical protein
MSRHLFRRIAERAMQAGFAGHDIMITLAEHALTDRSVGHGRCCGDQRALQAIDAWTVGSTENASQFLHTNIVCSRPVFGI